MDSCQTQVTMSTQIQAVQGQGFLVLATHYTADKDVVCSVLKNGFVYLERLIDLPKDVWYPVNLSVGVCNIGHEAAPPYSKTSNKG